MIQPSDDSRHLKRRGSSPVYSLSLAGQCYATAAAAAAAAAIGLVALAAACADRICFAGHFSPFSVAAVDVLEQPLEDPNVAVHEDIYLVVRAGRLAATKEPAAAAAAEAAAVAAAVPDACEKGTRCNPKTTTRQHVDGAKATPIHLGEHDQPSEVMNQSTDTSEVCMVLS